MALDAPVAGLIPEAQGLPIGEQTWERVLSHRSGLVAWEPFYERLPEKPGTEEAVAWIVADLLPRSDQATGGTSVDSDLGYILAGIAMSRAAGATLDEVIEQHGGWPDAFVTDRQAH